MGERRRAERHSITYYIQLMDSSNQKVIGNLVDISTTGIRIDGTLSLPVGREIHIRMDTTQATVDMLHIDFVARVKWCQADLISPGLFDIGLDLISISPSGAKALNHVAEKYGFHKPEFNF